MASDLINISHLTIVGVDLAFFLYTSAEKCSPVLVSNKTGTRQQPTDKIRNTQEHKGLIVLKLSWPVAVITDHVIFFGFKHGQSNVDAHVALQRPWRSPELSHKLAPQIFKSTGSTLKILLKYKGCNDWFLSEVHTFTSDYLNFNQLLFAELWETHTQQQNEVLWLFKMSLERTKTACRSNVSTVILTSSND